MLPRCASQNQGRLGKETGIATAAIGVVLLVGGCGIGELEPAGRAADAFGAAVAGQQWASAAAMVCTNDQASVTPAALAGRFSAPAITGYSSGGVQISDLNGHTTAQAELDFHTESGLDSNVTVPLVKENNQWRPCPRATSLAKRAKAGVCTERAHQARSNRG